MSVPPPGTSGVAVPAGGRKSARRFSHLRARLSLPVTRRAAGLLEGRHRSILQGHGQDFDDLSLYSPGDDVGDIDWKSSARAGIPVIKRFVRQSNLTVVLAVDTGRTMAAMAADGHSKAEVAVEAALLVAYLAQDRGDRVALVAADKGRMTHLPPRTGTAHLELVLRTIERAFDVEAPATDIDRLLVRVGTITRRSIVVLITDAANPTSAHRETLRRVCLRHEVLVLGIVDADPLRPATGPTRDVGDGWAIPEWLKGRDDLAAAAGAVRERRATERAAMLRGLRVHHDVVAGIDDVLLSLATLLDRSRRARR